VTTVPPTPVPPAMVGGALRSVPLISIVLVTTTWPAGLDVSVASVSAQEYPSWELIVVDDRRPAEPPGALARGDGRVRVLLGAGRGPAAAHNRGRDAAQGQLVTYLTDGVPMPPGWLHAVARAAGDRPGAGAYLGAAGSGDLTAVAHRREVARFEEGNDPAEPLAAPLRGLTASPVAVL
jgi:glycosyltransferase involved in cell wall biosynthesis